MTRGYSVALAVAVVVGGILLASGCRTMTRHQYLTMFFDGVPPEHPPKPTAPQSGPAKAVVAARPAPPRPVPQVVHPPFAQNKCGTCHERSTISTGTKLPLRQLCFTCHKDFIAG